MIYIVKNTEKTVVIALDLYFALLAKTLAITYAAAVK